MLFLLLNRLSALHCLSEFVVFVAVSSSFSLALLRQVFFGGFFFVAVESVFSVDCRHGTAFFVRGPESEYIEVLSCDDLFSLLLVVPCSQSASPWVLVA